MSPLNGVISDFASSIKTGQEPEIVHSRGTDVRIDQTRMPIVIMLCMFRLCVSR
jgi:hypothetical protein